MDAQTFLQVTYCVRLASVYREPMNAETIRFRCDYGSLCLTFAHVNANTYRITHINSAEVPNASERDDLFVQVTRDGHTVTVDAGDGIVTGIAL